MSKAVSARNKMSGKHHKIAVKKYDRILFTLAKLLLAFAAVIAFMASRQSVVTADPNPTIIMVTPAGSANSETCGNAWSSACNLTAALEKARTRGAIYENAAVVYELWLKEGLYKPTANTVRSTSFSIPPNTRLFGGFWGYEMDRAQRTFYPSDPVRYTVLSGEINSANLNDNSVHVVTIQSSPINTTRPVVLDRLTIMGGYADANNQNYGGGLYITGSKVYLSNSLIYENYSKLDGGGLYIDQTSSVEMVNTQVVKNTAGQNGGGIYARDSLVELTNTAFIQNTSKAGDGAFAGEGATLKVVNSIFWMNPGLEPAIDVQGNQTANTDISYSLVQGGCPGTCTGVATTPVTTSPFLTGPTDTTVTVGGVSITLPTIIIQENSTALPFADVTILDPYDVDADPRTNEMPYNFNGENNTNPTAVVMLDFSTAPEGEGILLSWQTASEINNVGFRIFRQAASSPSYTLLTPELILSQSPGSLIGASYTYFDAQSPNETIQYVLEAIDADGSSQYYHATFTPIAGAGVITRRVFLPLMLKP